MTFRLFTVSLFALVLAACNPMTQMEMAEESIEKFHAAYNAGEARGLYAMTSDEFRDITPVDEMENLVAKVDETMGAVESSERTQFNVNSASGQTITTIVMTTRFARGEGTETFTFLGAGDDMRLAGWNVDSPNFIQLPERVITDLPAEESAGSAIDAQAAQ